MKNVFVLFLMAFCVSILGCATTDRPVETLVDGTYTSVMQVDQWIKDNMW